MGKMDVGGTIKLKSSPAYFEWEWEIPSICIISKSPGDYFLSPNFITSFFKLHEWSLGLLVSPKSKQEDEDWLGLYLYYCGKEKVTANVTLSIIDNKCRKIDIVDIGERVFDPSGRKSNWGCPKLTQKSRIFDEKNGFLVGGKLKILCEMIFKPDSVVPKQISTADSNKGNVAHKLQAFNDFEKLFESEHHSDVTIIIDDSKIQAHKAIITSRSPVFDAMFQHDMKEKEKNTIEIADVSYEVMKEVLRFMYASKVNDIQKIAGDLLIAAEKYSVGGLKALCEETLYENLKNENAIEFLKLADMCNAANLKSQVIEFIIHNQQAITEKSEFELFGDLHSKLQCELFRAVVAKNTSQ